VHEAVAHRVHAGSQQLGVAPDRRHERVFERAFPALDLDRLRDPAEHHGQVVPEDRADHEREQQAVVLAAARSARSRARRRRSRRGTRPPTPSTGG
jgi:hypothetical protein